MQNMNNLLKQAQKLQQQFTQSQEKLEKIEVEGTAGGGAVKIISTATGNIKSVSIDPEVVDPDDVEYLEDLILAALKNLNENIEKTTQQELGPLANGLNIPGLF